ncbi:MAG: bifunctional UDP-sugar hydrolase/5'-nucleotidase [Actinomycetaceae bacterium]|nr:bifunctional UDP-sugar hydrolase/5'-nucleotidase [Actinomycetaceae bacterium]
MHAGKRRKGVVASFVAVLLGLYGLVGAPAVATENEDGTVTVDVAAITDLHGHIEHAGAIAYQIDEMRKANPDTIFAGNGDLVGGSAYVSSIANDEPTLDILNKMNLEVSSLGNHEFDQGYSDIVDRLSQRANWPYLVANVEGVDESVVKPYHVITTPAGVKVGFVGTVADDLSSLVSPAGIAGLNVTDPVAATDRYAAQLKDGDEANGEADIVVALMHAGDSTAARVGADVDAVVAGHTHTEANTTTASGAPVIEPAYYGTYIGKLSFSYDKNAKKVASVTGENIKVGDRTKDESVPVNDEVQAMYEQAQVKADELGAQQIGTIDGLAMRGTNNGTDSGANRGTESSLGNLVAEGFYAYGQNLAKKPDFGIINPGGLRGELDPNKDGIVTLEESYTVQPFGNAYATVELSSAQVYTLLEHQWSRTGDEARPILRLGLSKNISYVYDPDAPVGSKVTSVTLNGTVLDRNDTATKHVVASNNFLLAGGDHFDIFQEDDVAATYTDTGLIDNDVFNDYLRANPGLKVDYTQRSFGVTGPTSVAPGEKVTYRLSSLVLTNIEPGKPETVSLDIDGQEVGSAAIDPTVTPNTDESGRAEVSFEVPSGLAAGEHTLTVTAGDSTANAAITVGDAGQPSGNTFVFGQNAFAFGRSGDVPLMGDWDGDGVDTPAVKRGNRFFIKNSLGGGQADESFQYGHNDDVALVGDWDGDGKDTIAVRRGNDIHIKNSLAGGKADVRYKFGLATDTPIAGDWDGDGKDTVAVGRDGQARTYFVRNDLQGGPAEYSYELGVPTDKPVAGKWTDDARADTISYVRDGNLYVNTEAQPEPGAALDGTPIGGTAASTYLAGVVVKASPDTVGYRG